MTSENRPKTKRQKLDESLYSGRPLNAQVLGYHLGVDRDTAAAVAEARGLSREAGSYPWRQIWRRMHGIEGSALERHFDDLKTRHPQSIALRQIDDLEMALRAPLVKFPKMAAMLGIATETLRKQIGRGAWSVPFPVVMLGPRLRLYRPVEVRLWRDEEILLGLPEAAQLESTAATQVTMPETLRSQPPIDAQARKKAIFGGGMRAKRNPAE